MAWKKLWIGTDEIWSDWEKSLHLPRDRTVTLRMLNVSKKSQPRKCLEAALKDFHQSDLLWMEAVPPNDGWTLSADTCRFLISVIGYLKPRHILEFGSGLSTQVIYHACQSLHPPCHISSMDHDPEFRAKKIKEQRTSKTRVSLQFAPIVARDFGGKMLPVYLIDEAKFASNNKPDLIIIDGPPLVLGGREGVLYQALTLSKPGTLILLDDASRNEEKMALTRCRDNLGEMVEVEKVPGFVKGLAAIIVKTPLKQENFFKIRKQLIEKDIQENIPRKYKLILVDESWFGKGLAPRHTTFPFIEKDGIYWGPPPDSQTAIAELKRLKEKGARFILFAWPSFWWLDCYHEFFQHLRSRYQCVMDNDRLILFNLVSRN